jgi:hypothetical protein
VKEIPGFKTLKAYRHGRLWYIVDCTPECSDPFTNTIGGRFETYRGLVAFALARYAGEYD